jgi:hypothetical protein
MKKPCDVLTHNKEEGRFRVYAIGLLRWFVLNPLWESSKPPRRELEEVVLFEMRTGEVMMAGLVWLTRAVS